MIEELFLLLVGHSIADFSLQSESMARGKNRHRVPDDVPGGQKIVSVWFYYLTAHALVHAGFVYFITGSFLLGLIELVLHWVIDFVKCENVTNPHQDQFMHLLCKIFYVMI